MLTSRLFSKPLFLALALGLFAAAPANARNRSRPERRASLVWLLASTQSPLTRPTLDALGPDTSELLIDIANAPREAHTVRVRALAGLGFYASEPCYSFLASLLHERNLLDNAEGQRMRRQAIRSLGWAFGDRAVDELLPLRLDQAPPVRRAVAIALGDTRSQRALPTLELWLSSEQDINVREAVDKAVSQIRGRP
jgi:HEAT repeat protein